MAEIPWKESQSDGTLYRLVIWPSMRSGDIGVPYPVAVYQETIGQSIGYFGPGGGILWEGTLVREPTEKDWYYLHSAVDHEISSLPPAFLVRPRITTGSGAELSPHLLCKGRGRR